LGNIPRLTPFAEKSWRTATAESTLSLDREEYNASKDVARRFNGAGSLMVVEVWTWKKSGDAKLRCVEFELQGGSQCEDKTSSRF
jgi:hypothetical protein